MGIECSKEGDEMIKNTSSGIAKNQEAFQKDIDWVLTLFREGDYLDDKKSADEFIRNRVKALLKKHLNISVTFSNDNPLSMMEMIYLSLLFSDYKRKEITWIIKNSLDTLYTYDKRIKKKLKTRTRESILRAIISKKYIKFN